MRKLSVIELESVDGAKNKHFAYGSVDVPYLGSFSLPYPTAKLVKKICDKGAIITPVMALVIETESKKHKNVFIKGCMVAVGMGLVEDNVDCLYERMGWALE
jgi:hypothetical protein